MDELNDTLNRIFQTEGWDYTSNAALALTMPLPDGCHWRIALVNTYDNIWRVSIYQSEAMLSSAESRSLSEAITVTWIRWYRIEHPEDR